MRAETLVNTIMTDGHSSLEKYTSYTLFEMLGKGCEMVMCERWVGDWTKTATYWPPVPLSFSFYWAAQPEALSTPLCWELVLTASNCSNWLQTNWTSCRTGLYHCFTSTCFLWASHLHSIQPVHSQGIPWYLRLDAPVSWSTAGSKVNMLHK